MRARSPVLRPVAWVRWIVPSHQLFRTTRQVSGWFGRRVTSTAATSADSLHRSPDLSHSRRGAVDRCAQGLCDAGDESPRQHSMMLCDQRRRTFGRCSARCASQALGNACSQPLERAWLASLTAGASGFQTTTSSRENEGGDAQAQQGCGGGLGN